MCILGSYLEDKPRIQAGILESVKWGNPHMSSPSNSRQPHKRSNESGHQDSLAPLAAGKSMKLQQLPPPPIFLLFSKFKLITAEKDVKDLREIPWGRNGYPTDKSMFSLYINEYLHLMSYFCVVLIVLYFEVITIKTDNMIERKNVCRQLMRLCFSNTVTNTVWNNGASSYAVPRTSAQIPQSPALKSKPNWEESGSRSVINTSCLDYFQLLGMNYGRFIAWWIIYSEDIKNNEQNFIFGRRLRRSSHKTSASFQ